MWESDPRCQYLIPVPYHLANQEIETKVCSAYAIATGGRTGWVSRTQTIETVSLSFFAILARPREIDH
jgi:hypothetical protein